MAATAPLPAQAAPKPATVWIDQDLGVPVRFVMDSPDPSGTGTVHFEINVTQINVPVQITAPPGRALGRKPSSRQTEPTWSDYAKSLVDSILGVFTGVSPFDTKQAVDTVAEAAPSIQENRENAEEYFDAYPDAPDRDRYTMADEDLSNKTSLYKWFWGLFE